MLSSSPSYIKCYECKKSPNQFTFLICNHIKCGKCISKSTQKTPKYSIIKCPCGRSTYFNDQNQIVEDEEIISSRKKGIRQKKQQRNSIEERISYKSKQTTNPNSKTLINQRSTMPMLQVSSVFSLNRSQSQQNPNFRSLSPAKQRYLNESSTKQYRDKIGHKVGTQKTAYEQSLLLQNQFNGSSYRNPQQNAINEFSTHQITEKPHQYAEYEQKMLRKIKSVKSSAVSKKQNILNENKQKSGIVHSQFQSEIEFMSMRFKKDVEQIQYSFRNILQDFNNNYQQLQQEIRSLYVEEVITRQSMVKLNISELVSKKYHHSLGQKFKNLKDQLFLLTHSKYQSRQSINKLKDSLFETFKPTQNTNCSKELSDQKYCENQQNNALKRLKKGKVSHFQTVEEKLQRLTVNKNQRKSRNHTQNEEQQDQDLKRRFHTQNIHTNIKRPNHNQFNDKKQRPTRCETNDNRSEIYIRSNDKGNHTLNFRKSPKQDCQRQNMRKQIIYYSPPLPYCYKHFEKRSKQAKNYISYIEKMCHEKKMKNTRELFKKVKQSHPYQFKNRD